jgi:hypothetical protein
MRVSSTFCSQNAKIVTTSDKYWSITVMRTRDKLKPTFQLNKTQKSLLIAKERESFVRHCNRLGWNPKDMEKQFHENFIERDRELIEGLRQGAKNNNFELELHTFDPLLRSKNYWQYIHVQTTLKRKHLANMICEAAPSLPINYAYASQIAKVMGLSEVSEKNPDSLKNFLLNAPLMNVFDLEFNAFVTGDSIIGDIPCVCFHTSLPELAEFFTNLFLSALIPENIEGRIRLPSDEILNNKANNSEFIASCVSGFRGLLGTSSEILIVPQCYFSKLHPQLTFDFLTALKGSSSFVGLHEFGHFLMGHLEKTYVPSLELEADAFAARILVKTAKNWPELQWIALGLATIFSILEMIEVLNPTALETHPKATDRLAALENEIQGINLCGVGNAIKQLWIPSYRKLEELAQT